MESVLSKLPACPCMPILQALERMGYAGSVSGERRWLRAEEDERGSIGLAVIVGDNECVGVASAIYDTAERDEPRIEWSTDRGHLLRLYQTAMRRVGHARSVNVATLMGEMQ